MRSFTVLALSLVPCIAAAQGSPVADAFRHNAQQVGKNLVAAAEEMPADKYSFKPTPQQMSFADVVVHLAEGNDYLCGTIAGTKAPTRGKVEASASKDALVARLKETFAFCDQSLASLDDSKLGEQLPFFGGKPGARRGDDADDRGLGRPLQPGRDLPPPQRPAAADGEEARNVTGGFSLC